MVQAGGSERQDRRRRRDKSGEHIGRPLSYAENAFIWGLIWDSQDLNTDQGFGRA